MKQKIFDNIIKKNLTPIYVFDIDELNNRIKYLRKKLPKSIGICYAIKANTFVIEEMSQEIDKFEVCSPGEYYICEEAKVSPEKIVISGVNKEYDAIDYMMSSNPKIGRYTVESIEQLELLNELSQKHNLKIDILLRLTSGNQFGINEEDIETIIKNNKKYNNLNIVGIQYFSGTQKRTIKRLQKEINYLDEFLARIQGEFNFLIQELEFGAGFPVFYFKEDEFEEDEFLKMFSESIESMTYKGKIIIELGRSVVASCGSYLTKVVDTKKNCEQNYAILDGGINHLVYYGQMMGMKIPSHELYPKIISEDTENWNLMGSLCTTNDFIVKQLPVRRLKKGDIFIFKKTGAYCMTEGISLFLSRDLPRVAIVKGEETIIVRDVFKTYTLNKANYKIKNHVEEEKKK